MSSPEKLSALAEKGLYEASEWKERLTKLGSTTPGGLESVAPPGYAGDTVNERLASYAEDLARKVRQSFPTKVVAQRISKDELVLGDDHARVKGHVTRLLKNAEDKGVPLQLGKTPIGVLLRKNGDALFDGVPQSERATTGNALKLLQRLYQVTPSDHALGVLLSLGIRSASDVAALRLEDFLRRFGSRFRPREAELVHSKCVQVSHVVFNSFVHAQQILNPSGVGVLSPTPEGQAQAQTNLRNHFPTLETLFGSLDYCECEHCRSVLSPAAYFVDLLQFLDPADFEWGNVLSKWKTAKGTDYPYVKPYDVLTGRRPDLVHVALTCENTNTALPYIDVVNEVLEYYVGHGKLDCRGGARHRRRIVRRPARGAAEHRRGGLPEARRGAIPAHPTVRPLDRDWPAVPRALRDILLGAARGLSAFGRPHLNEYRSVVVRAFSGVSGATRAFAGRGGPLHGRAGHRGRVVGAIRLPCHGIELTRKHGFG